MKTMPLDLDGLISLSKPILNKKVILTKTLERRQIVDIVSKIALQVNVKLGGELWACNKVYVSI